MSVARGCARRSLRAICRASRSAPEVTVQVFSTTRSTGAPPAGPVSGARRSPRDRRRASSAAESAWLSLQPSVTMRYVDMLTCGAPRPAARGCPSGAGAALQGAVLLDHLARHLVLVLAQPGAQVRVRGGEYLRRQDGGILRPRLADGDRRDRYPAGHLHRREQRVHPLQRRRWQRDADDRDRRVRRHHAGQVRRVTRPEDGDAEAVLLEGLRQARRLARRAVGAGDVHLVRDAERLEGLCRLLHDRQIAVAAHGDPDLVPITAGGPGGWLLRLVRSRVRSRHVRSPASSKGADYNRAGASRGGPAGESTGRNVRSEGPSRLRRLGRGGGPERLLATAALEGAVAGEAETVLGEEVGHLLLPGVDEADRLVVGHRAHVHEETDVLARLVIGAQQLEDAPLFFGRVGHSMPPATTSEFYAHPPARTAPGGPGSGIDTARARRRFAKRANRHSASRSKARRAISRRLCRPSKRTLSTAA